MTGDMVTNKTGKKKVALEERDIKEMISKNQIYYFKHT